MKKIILTFAIIFLLQNKAFTQFEINFAVPLGFSAISPYAEGATSKSMIQLRPYQIDYRDIEPAFNVNAGALMQIGGSFDLGNKTGVISISLLAEVGYYLETFGAAFGETDFPADVQENIIYLHTLNLGIMPKINIYMPNATPFSVGLGGGVKIPFSGTRYVTMRSSSSREDIEEKMSYKDIKETFIYSFIPYIKFTMDTYFYVSKKVAFTFGMYMAYDFPMKYDTDKINSDNKIGDQGGILMGYDLLKLTEYGSSSFDVGFTFGISFGRPDPKLKL